MGCRLRGQVAHLRLSLIRIFNNFFGRDYHGKPFFERSKVGWNLEAPKRVPCAARVELYCCARRGYTVPGHDQALNHPLHVLEGSCGSAHEAKKLHFSEEVGLSILVFERTL